MELLAACQSRVVACIYALIHNMHETEDLYQQACLVMWRKFDTYQPGTQFVKWACSIAYLEAVAYLRQREGKARFREEFIKEFAPWKNPRTTDVDRSIDALHPCMERLSESDRHLLQMRYWVPKTVVQIAAELGRTPQSVCSSLGRIRVQLLGCIKRALSSEDRR
jgi:RNA polymerase sigma-70 factor, ECF subfamily